MGEEELARDDRAFIRVDDEARPQPRFGLVLHRRLVVPGKARRRGGGNGGENAQDSAGEQQGSPPSTAPRRST